MFSGIMERIKKVKKLSIIEKQELKEDVLRHHNTIREYLNDNQNTIPRAVLNALEDRLILLSQTRDKL